MFKEIYSIEVEVNDSTLYVRYFDSYEEAEKHFYAERDAIADKYGMEFYCGEQKHSYCGSWSRTLLAWDWAIIFTNDAWIGDKDGKLVFHDNKGLPFQFENYDAFRSEVVGRKYNAILNNTAMTIVKNHTWREINGETYFREQYKDKGQTIWLWRYGRIDARGDFLILKDGLLSRPNLNRLFN